MLDHPSIAGRIALLESEVQAKEDSLVSLRNEFSLLQDRGIQYAERVKNVLYDLYKDPNNYDENTILAVMRHLNIDTRSSKKFEVNVTFEVELEFALGENVDASYFEWDTEYEISSGYHTILEQTPNVIYSREI
jgi:hypothetical protein